ncbi:MAG: TspO/MBR family protein [Gammaproteobacteria bacterium]
MTNSRYWPAAPIALALSFAVAAVGGSLTDLGSWYQALEQPSWKPPDWAFGPAWTTIFLLCAAAGALAWVNATNAAQKKQIAIAFAINAVLNVMWSGLFFHLHRPDWALWQVGVLWLSVLSLIVVCGRISKLAGALLVPYLIWVAFASTINFGVVQLNF